MQKFTRSLTREIDVGGERVSVTLDAAGVTVRPVGSRRPPHVVSWAGVIHAATTHLSPTPEQVADSVNALKKGGEKTEAAPAMPAAEASSAPSSAPEPTGEGEPAGEAGSSPPQSWEHSASGLASILTRIDTWLAKHRAAFHKSLNPPASDDECNVLAVSVGGSLPGELRTLLQWHNGQNDDMSGAFERNFHLLDCNRIVRAKKEMDSDPSNGWKLGMIPILDDDQNNLVALEPTQPGTPVVECWYGESEVRKTAPSLTAWLGGYAQSLEAGKYHEDPERGGFHRKS